MARVYQVPRHAFGWMLLAVVLATLPHLLASPVWLAILVLGCVAWRALTHRNLMSRPGFLPRIVLLTAALAGTLYAYGTVLGPEAGVCLLVAAFSLKLLEMNSLRDARVVVVLAYFVLATAFLIDQGAFTALYVVGVLVIVTAALVGINHPETGVRARSHGRLALVMLGQSLPLMLVLFLLVPRIPPLWSLEIERGEMRTGVSDSMAPGEVSSLSQSNELAFRVEFFGDVPPPRERYWRGLTYAEFEDGRWSQSVHRELRHDYVRFPGDPGPAPDWMTALRADRDGIRYRYRVVMEPSQRQWLYAMTVPFANQRELGLARDMRLIKRDDVNSTFAYEVTSYPDMRRGRTLEGTYRRYLLDLPEQGNSRARRLAREWHGQADSDQAYIQRVLGWFRDEAFFYTLNPPPTGDDMVDDFLFDTRRGFCGHYASAFTFLMRAAGIPARVVAGYQGGEMNPLGNHLRVRQRDAHAWVEVWLDGQGWVEADPSAAVAPSRIEFGLDRALEDQGEDEGIFGDLGGLGNIGLFKQLTFLSDYIQFAWYNWVVGYDSESQFELLGDWLGEVSPMRLALALAGGLGVIVLPLAAWVLLGGRAPGLSPLQREYWRMVRMLRRRGIEVGEGVAPRDLAALVAAQAPHAGPAAMAWSRYYEKLVYGGYVEEDRHARRHLRRRRGAVKAALLRDRFSAAP